MASHLEALRAEARSLPQAPGVYFWKDAQERTLYIGKAVNLRNRVGSYFVTARHDRRVRELLSKAQALHYELAGSELEALLRESALIKQQQPPFNRALRTPHRPYYLTLNGELGHPTLEITRERGTGPWYFGPFDSAGAASETMRFVHDILPLRKCARANPNCQPCLYYQMHKCAAPYLDAEHQHRHEDAIAQLESLLDGRSDRVISWLEQKRDRLSRALLFERAADVQARLDRLRLLLERQSILYAAVRCRCVLIRLADQEEPRLLLVAHGSVISIHSACLDVPSAVTWIRAHRLLVERVIPQQSETDSASVIARWLNVKREHVRWIAIPSLEGDELVERVSYVLQAENAPIFVRRASRGVPDGE